MPLKAASDVADAEDVAKLYNLLLRREPENETVVSRNVGQKIADLLQKVLNSAEFHDRVLHPLICGQALWGTYRGKANFDDLRQWAVTALPVGPDFWGKLATRTSWEDFYLAFLLEARVREFDPKLREPNVHRALELRRLDALLNTASRDVVGRFDYVNLWEVRGWCADEANLDEHLTIEIFADNFFIGISQCDEYRRDAQELVGGKGVYGFTFRFPANHFDLFQTDRWISAREQSTRRTFGRLLFQHDSLPERMDRLGKLHREVEQVKAALGRIEAELPEYNRLLGFPLYGYTEYFAEHARHVEERLAVYTEHLRKLSARPLVSLLMSISDSSLEALHGSIQSLREQIYPDWELLINVHGAHVGEEGLRLFLERQALIEPRVKVTTDETATRTFDGIHQCSGALIGVLECGDRLAPDSLFHAVLAVQDGLADLIYSDEDKFEIVVAGSPPVHHTPQFKPDFDLDLLLCYNYLGSLLLVSAQLLRKVGPLGSGLLGPDHYDLVLRLIECVDAARIRHIPRVLYHRNAARDALDVDAAVAGRIQENSLRAVNSYFDRNGVTAKAEPHADPLGRAHPQAARIRWALPKTPPVVSIIIPTRDRKELVGPCLGSLTSVFREYPGRAEIIVVDNDTTEPDTKALLKHFAQSSGGRVLSLGGPFNWSALNNFAVTEARGEVLIFLNNDTLVLSEDWCTELVSQALRPDVGAVGTRLLYEDGSIQHAGVVTGVGRGLAAHEGVGETVVDGGYLGRSHLQRSVSAVTGACLATRKTVFEQVHGFDEINLQTSFNDIDYCLKVRQARLKVVYTPFATMYHYESKSRGIGATGEAKRRQDREELHFRSRWQDLIDDPFYNPHFERYAKPFTVLQPPRAFWSRVGR
jgi:GT2 family glycosyltransferase